jgi:hypothetical protein
MVQEVINIGAGPNDGTGDPLRTSFNKINNNFSQLFKSVVSTDLAFSGNTITTGVTGTTNGNLILQPQGVGSVVIGPTNILYGTTANITNFQANNAVFTGTVTASQYGFVGSLNGTASAATIAATATYAATAGTAINAQNYSGTQLPNVTAIGNLNYINVGIMNVATINTNANIYASGNITAGPASYVLGNGYYLSGLSGVTPSTYGNSNVAAYLTINTGNVNANWHIGNTISSVIGTNANITLRPDGTGDVVSQANLWINSGYLRTTSSTLYLSNSTPTTVYMFGNASTILMGNASATNTLPGNIIIGKTANVGGNLNVSGNINSLGNLIASYDIIVGPPGTVPTANLTAQFVDNSNYYTQINIQNIGNGSSTSADIVATANNGNDSAYYVDLGINANNYTNSSYTITYPNDAYLYVANGNIALGTASTGKAIVFHTDGTLLSNEAGRITSGRWVVGGTDDATNKLQVTGTARFYSNVTVANITSIGNVTSTFFYGNGSTLAGMYGNTQVAAYLPTYLPTNTANVAAGNLVATGNVGGTYFIGNGSLLTGLYSNIQAAAYLPTYSGNISVGNVITTGNVNATYFIGSSQYLTGLYSNASVAGYLPTYYTNANIAANGVSSTSYILGYIAINGYTFANLANSTTKSVTLYGNVSTLILDNTAGATVSIANVYLPANANISDGTKITISSNITISTLNIIANDSSVSGNVSSISPTTPYSWHYVKYAPYNGNPIPQQLPGGPRWIRVG